MNLAGRLGRLSVQKAGRAPTCSVFPGLSGRVAAPGTFGRPAFKIGNDASMESLYYLLDHLIERASKYRSSYEYELDKYNRREKHNEKQEISLLMRKRTMEKWEGWVRDLKALLEKEESGGE